MLPKQKLEWRIVVHYNMLLWKDLTVEWGLLVFRAVFYSRESQVYLINLFNIFFLLIYIIDFSILTGLHMSINPDCSALNARARLINEADKQKCGKVNDMTILFFHDDINSRLEHMCYSCGEKPASTRIADCMSCRGLCARCSEKSHCVGPNNVVWKHEPMREKRDNN